MLTVTFKTEIDVNTPGGIQASVFLRSLSLYSGIHAFSPAGNLPLVSSGSVRFLLAYWNYLATVWHDWLFSVIQLSTFSINSLPACLCFQPLYKLKMLHVHSVV